MTQGAVIVETRELVHIREIVMNHIKFTGWPVTFFHSPFNEGYLKDKLKLLDVSFVNLHTNIMNEHGYNNLLTSEKFWRQIPYNKVLIFQHDSRLLRTGIEEFMEWDYVGAPWIFQKHGGNGGLSLRNKIAMIRCIAQKPYNTSMGNEDIYYSNIMYRNPDYKLAPPSVCQKFCCEVIFKLGTFGYHAIEKWMGKENISLIQNQYGAADNR